jgi:hypothetical protein
VRLYDEARRSHTDRAWSLFTEGSNLTEPDAPVELPGFGWCVDEGGVRAVHPYLVAHEQRQRAGRRRPASRASGQGRSGSNVSSEAVDAGTRGEWDELAGLIRQWEAQRAPAV